MKAKRIKIGAFTLFEKVKLEKPVIHHLTNWVTIYDCANIVKTIGASPVMAHAREEVAQMAGIASALVLNIGTLDVDLVESMKLAAKKANKKGIPVVLDACGAGATRLRDKKCFELLDETRIDIIKGNVSEVARLSGEKTRTKGVDALEVSKDPVEIARDMAKKRSCTVVITGKEDIIADKKKLYVVKNGHPMMGNVVGTGCMASSVIAAFAAVEKDYAFASCSALVCFEIAAECAVKRSSGPASFKENMFDCLYNLDRRALTRMQKVDLCV